MKNLFKRCCFTLIIPFFFFSCSDKDDFEKGNVISKQELLGKYIVIDSNTNQTLVGDIWQIEGEVINIGCTEPIAYTYANNTIVAGGTRYKISKDKVLIIEYSNAGVNTILSLQTTTAKCPTPEPPQPPEPSIGIKKADIEAVMTKVSDWQISIYDYPAQGNPKGGMLDWTSGTLFIGMMNWADIAKDQKYHTWLKNQVGVRSGYKISTTLSQYPKYGIYHADDLCIGQFYLMMYSKYKDEAMITSIRNRINAIIAKPPLDEMDYTKSLQQWTWCDALFMAPAAYAQMGQITNDPKYLNFMDKHFLKTYNHLYDEEENLFFRDNSYFDRIEPNGKKMFWGRGQGWVVAGLSNMLKYLPENHAQRKLYANILSEMLEKLVTCQDENGFWHPSLLDMESYPYQETSASSLITYSIAYGINNNILDKKKYIPILEKAWKALCTAVQADGKLGWVQPIGQNPKVVTKDMTAVYGVGGFLMAGAEIHKLAGSNQ